MKTKRATMQDVADAAGVSIATVDRILNRRAPVKRATVDHVLDAAERVGYHGIPSIQNRLTENAPAVTFGFLLNAQGRGLYSELAKLLAERVRSSRVVRGTVVVRHLGSIASEETALALEDLASACDAIAVVAVDTPEVNAAVEKVALSGTPVFAMFSDLSSPHRAGFIGSDAVKMGRGAGWMVERLSPSGGEVGLIIGSADYAAHRGYAEGFRSYLDDRGSALLKLDMGETLESDTIAERLTREIIQDRPDLVAILVAGGGLGGAVRAVCDAGRRIVLVGTELSAEIDAGLTAGMIDAVLSHPAAVVAEKAVSAMELAVTSLRRQPSIQLVPIEIRISETV